VIEVAFGANQADDLAVLARGGVIATYASDAQPEPVVSFRDLMVKDAVLRFVLIYEAPQAARDAAARDITAMLETGVLSHQIAQVLPLTSIVAAHEAMEAGKLVGKTLIDLNMAQP
jgi:NADPH2:quinone reductase